MTTESPVTVHRLTGKDISTMTATCSVDGLVAIRRAGNGHQCATAKAAAHRRWAEANPERSRANRRQRSDHEVFGQDYVKLTAKCVRCGPVDLVAWGRGYACGIRARELRTLQEPEPTLPCRECFTLDGTRVYPVDGTCPRCTDPARTDTGKALRYAECRSDDLDGVGYGYTVEDITGDPYAMDDYESAVPGWRTLGSTRPWSAA